MAKKAQNFFTACFPNGQLRGATNGQHWACQGRRGVGRRTAAELHAALVLGDLVGGLGQQLLLQGYDFTLAIHEFAQRRILPFQLRGCSLLDRIQRGAVLGLCLNTFRLQHFTFGKIEPFAADLRKNLENLGQEGSEIMLPRLFEVAVKSALMNAIRGASLVSEPATSFAIVLTR